MSERGVDMLGEPSCIIEYYQIGILSYTIVRIYIIFQSYHVDCVGTPSQRTRLRPISTIFYTPVKESIQNYNVFNIYFKNTI